MSTSHTPGPWAILHDSPPAVRDSAGNNICPEVCHPADARLIAAAPDLFAALEWALDQIDDDLDPDHQAAFAAAHKALKSAKG